MKYTKFLFAVILAAFFVPYAPSYDNKPILAKDITYASEARPVTSPFLYNFSWNGILEEAGIMSESSSPYFWINSGAKLIIENGSGKTVQKSLSQGDRWQSLYKTANPLDTGEGYFPQNIFRLVTRSSWKNLREELRFKIAKINMTDTPNRNGYSGLLLFSRYKDSQNLYYAGIRMDGKATIKKKINGAYYTMAEAKVFSADSGYDKEANPNLIPGNKWMRIKMETKDLPDGSVSISLFLDKTDLGTYAQILSATDKPGLYGGTDTVKGPTYAGFRSDYMDLIFDDYKLTEM